MMSSKPDKPSASNAQLQPASVASSTHVGVTVFPSPKLQVNNTPLPATTAIDEAQEVLRKRSGIRVEAHFKCGREHKVDEKSSSSSDDDSSSVVATAQNGPKLLKQSLANVLMKRPSPQKEARAGVEAGKAKEPQKEEQKEQKLLKPPQPATEDSKAASIATASPPAVEKVEMNGLDGSASSAENKEQMVSVSSYGGIKHLFIAAAATAWSDHYPIAFRPDNFWLLIVQGVSSHFNKNVEALKDRVVTHEGKQTLILDRDGFVKGNPNNDWPGVFEDFVKQIQTKIKPVAFGAIQSAFSTTTLLDTLAYAVTTMDLCRSFFEYKVRTRCGFPSVTMEGSKDDWTQLRARAEQLLRALCLPDFAKWWGKALYPILDRFVKLYDEEPLAKAHQFWNDMIKKGAVEGSGGYSYITGWINAFIPYLSKDTKDLPAAKGDLNPFIDGKSVKLDVTELGNGLSSAPVIWEYLGQNFNMEFCAGFMGATQHRETMQVRPVIGWVVVEKAGAGKQAGGQ